MDFSCVSECADCCIKREYYPDVRYGKIGVLILPEERRRITNVASKKGIKLRMLPRIGVSESGKKGPDKILAYQMMGRDANGDTCPFLDTAGAHRSPHGGYPCRIYDQRPLACAAYPLVGHAPLQLDKKCRFCKECAVTADGNLESEVRSLLKIEQRVSSNAPTIWRFATQTGDKCDQKQFAKMGWIQDPDLM